MTHILIFSIFKIMENERQRMQNEKWKQEMRNEKWKTLDFMLMKIENKKYVHSHFMVYLLSRWHFKMASNSILLMDVFSYHSVKLSNLSLTAPFRFQCIFCFRCSIHLFLITTFSIVSSSLMLFWIVFSLFYGCVPIDEYWCFHQ